MASTPSPPCPFCGSADTQAFADASGVCRTCGRAFRGTTPIGGMIAGERVEVHRTARVREKLRAGLLGIAGGLLGIAGIPSVFLVGSAIHREGLATYVPDVFNRSSGALVCGGLSLLVVGGVYAMWAGFHVWRGFPERGIHLILAGALTAGAGALAGLGLAGIVGIVGGVLALVGGVLARRLAGAGEDGTPPAAAS